MSVRVKFLFQKFCIENIFKIKMKNQLKNNWKFFLIASLTLGLAPFNPPHIVGKLKWIFGGNAFLQKTE